MKIQITYNVVITSKMDESVDFYTKIFGYEVAADIEWYKQLKHPSGAEIGFMLPNHPSQPPLFKKEWKGEGLIFTIQVENVEDYYQSVKEAGIPIAFELTKEEFGQHHFAVIDPNGIPVDVMQEL